MGQINLISECFLHVIVMWLVLAITLATSHSSPTIAEGHDFNNSVIAENITVSLPKIEAKTTAEESINVTHSSVDTTTFEMNSTYQNTDISSKVDDLATSSFQIPVCASCTVVEYNSTDIDPKGNTSNYFLGNSTESEVINNTFNDGIIIGIVVLVVIIVLLMGVLGFFSYKRFYPTLCSNRPQTLTDKFSNDESNGYIDDSAFRENSEEMYSLDNDSFLNSLEAMTIQNYWTDHVRHTKL